uniref:Uncharacterized protein n=1 Tax=Plectus sambesii TaxID=2011161 RepID=A0A914VUH2_9BILA
MEPSSSLPPPPTLVCRPASLELTRSPICARRGSISASRSEIRPPDNPAFHVVRETSAFDLPLRHSLKRFHSEPLGLNLIRGSPSVLPDEQDDEDPPSSPMRLVDRLESRLSLPDVDNIPSTPTSSRSRHSSTHSLSCLPIRIPARSRVANIRRESNVRSCVENELAIERLVKVSQQVSHTFNDFSLEETPPEERKRAKSLTEPISILTNAFLPSSCSPSPTRVDHQKQCYSPSTQQVVRSNITYSPSPSPTPSPTRRLMRSLSPIAVRSMIAGKRKYNTTSSGSPLSLMANGNGGSGVESDGEGGSGSGGFWSAPKRACPSRGSIGSASPLVGDKDRNCFLSSFPPDVPNFAVPSPSTSNGLSSADSLKHCYSVGSSLDSDGEQSSSTPESNSDAPADPGPSRRLQPFLIGRESGDGDDMADDIPPPPDPPMDET